MTSLQIKLWILATIALIILIIFAKTNPKWQKLFKIDESSLKKKYAEEIANGSIKLEPQSDKYFYQLIFTIIFASLTVLFCENYFFPYLDKMSKTCELVTKIDLLLWLTFFAPIGFFVVFSSILTARFIKDYRDCLQTGYCYQENGSNLLVKIFKKENIQKIILKIIVLFVLALIIVIMLLIAFVKMNNFIHADNDKKIITMQKKCLKTKPNN